MSGPETIDVQGEIDRLFREPLDRFTSARNDLSRRLARSGDSDSAQRVKALLKPTLSAWAVNQLYWEDRETLEAVIEAGDRFRSVQLAALEGRPTAELPDASRDRREAVVAARHRIEELLRDKAEQPTASTLQRIETTLDAIAAYGSARAELINGRLARDLEPPGFEALAGLRKESPPPMPARSRAPVKPPPRPEAKSGLELRLARAKEALEKARADAAEKRHVADRARQAAAEAELQAGAARREAEEAQRRWTEATKKAGEARSIWDREKAAADRAVAAANRAEEEARKREEAVEKLR